MQAGSRAGFPTCPVSVRISEGSACEQGSDCDFVWTETVDYFSGCKKVNPGTYHIFGSVAKVENKHIYSEMMTIFLHSGDLGNKKEILMSRISPGSPQVTGRLLGPCCSSFCKWITIPERISLHSYLDDCFAFLSHAKQTGRKLQAGMSSSAEELGINP